MQDSALGKYNVEGPSMFGKVCFTEIAKNISYIDPRFFCQLKGITLVFLRYVKYGYIGAKQCQKNGHSTVRTAWIGNLFFSYIFEIFLMEAKVSKRVRLDAGRFFRRTAIVAGPEIIRAVFPCRFVYRSLFFHKLDVPRF